MTVFEWTRILSALELQVALLICSRALLSFPWPFSHCPFSDHPIPAFQIALVPGQASLGLESCRIPARRSCLL